MARHSDAIQLRKARRRKPFPVEPHYVYLNWLRDLRGQKRSALKALFEEKHNVHRGRVHPIEWASAVYADCLILHAPLRDEQLLAPTIEKAIYRGIKHVAIVGQDRVGIEYKVDRIIIADGNDPERFVTTSSHNNMRKALRACGRGCGVVRFCQLFI